MHGYTRVFVLGYKHKDGSRVRPEDYQPLVLCTEDMDSFTEAVRDNKDGLGVLDDLYKQFTRCAIPGPVTTLALR